MKAPDPAALDIDRLRRLTERTSLVRQILYRPETRSTNDDALAAGRRGEPEGLVFVADHQSRGRGTRGRTWQAPPNAALLVSVLLRPGEGVRPFALSQAAALALCEGLRSATKLDVRIKWPNDVMVNDRKLGGILVETAGGGSSRGAVVGMGANLNFSAAAIRDADMAVATVLDETGMPCDREAAIAAVLAVLDHRYAQLTRAESLSDPWAALSAITGRHVSVITPQGSFRGRVVGFGPQAELILAGDDGSLRHFTAGRVRLRPSPGPAD